MMKKQRFEDYWLKIKDFIRKNPVFSVVVALAALMVLIWILSSFELLPEVNRVRLPAGGVVIDQGDSLDWMGMKVVPVSRTIRAEFKVPRKIKGMFVLDEGVGIARKYGVKTGDVILSLSRKPVPDAMTFVKVANSVQYRDGILLDIYRDKKSFYLTIPFEYQYGPLMGPNKGGWQLGAPIIGQALPYGPVFDDNTNQRR